MRDFKLTLLCAICACFSFNFNSFGTRIMGAEMSYKWVSGNTFSFELMVYRDCGSQLGISNRQKIFFSSFSCRPTQDSINMILSGPPEDISPLCKREPSSCEGGTNQGVQRYKYIGTVTLTDNCSDWVFYYRPCNRSSKIGTILSPDLNCLYIETRLNNLLAPNNSSAKTSSSPIAYLCSGQPVNLNAGITDANGDGLKFQLVTPRTNTQVPNVVDLNVVKYKPGFSATSPMPSQNGFVFDSTTGQLSFAPNQEIIGQIAIKITEFRSGKIVGTSLIDIPVLVRSCENQLPTISGFDNGTSYEKLVCIGDSLDSEITALDENGEDSLQMNWNFGLLNGDFESESDQALTKGRLSWKPTLEDTGTKTFTITASDDRCPAIGSTTKVYTLRVKEKPTISNYNDTILPCGATIPISVSVLTGKAPFAFSWPGRNDNTPTIVVSHGKYTARVTDATGCFAEDTININGSSFSGYIKIDTSCVVEGVQLTASSFTQDSTLTFQYSWTFPPETTTYAGEVVRRTFPSSGERNVVLTITSSDNCSITIPSTFKVCDPPPALAQYAPNVCQGQPFRIGCGIPGIGGWCGAAVICVFLKERNWVTFPPGGVQILPPDSLKPDSNTFEIRTYSVSKCKNVKRFKFKVKASPKVKTFPDVGLIRFNCNKPDTTILVKIFKDFRFVNDSIWGKIELSDTIIKLPKTKEDTIFYTLKVSKPGPIFITGIMDNNCLFYKSINYEPLAMAYINTSPHCNPGDSIRLYPGFYTDRFKSYNINLGNGDQTTDSTIKILYPPNGLFNGYFAVEDSVGCKDTSNFIIDTRLPDTTVISSGDTACIDGFIRYRIQDTTLVYQWKIRGYYPGEINLDKNKMEDSIQFKYSGYHSISADISYKQGCTKSWNLPLVYVRPPIFPKIEISNICADQNSQLLGSIIYSENPVKKWKWSYSYPPGQNLPFSQDTIQNPIRRFNYNGNFRAILHIEDTKGCMARDTLDSTMVLVKKPEFSANGDCQNDSLIFFVGDVLDDYENIEKYTYYYSDGLAEVTGNGQGLHQFSLPGKYFVRLVASTIEGCTNSDTTLLEIKPRPKANFSLPPPEICQGQVFRVDGKNSRPAEGDESLTSFTWATSNENPVSTDTSTSISFEEPGQVYVALQVRSSNGCQDYLKLAMNSRPMPEANFLTMEEDQIKGDLISFQDLSRSADFWKWDFGDGSMEEISDSSKASASHSYTSGNNFIVKQYVKNSFGCADSISKEINLKSFIALPGAFSPNGDNRNDGFGLIHRFIQKLTEFKIYNRLGQLVFDAGTDLEKRWDGTIHGIAQPNGNFLYSAKARSIFGENLELKGSLTLIR